MSKPQSFRCWDITQCRSKNSCPASQYKDKQCWEVARERMDYQSTLRVCEDCFVYIALYDNANSSLTEEEIDVILEQKGLCNTASECVFSPSEGVEAA